MYAIRSYYAGFGRILFVCFAHLLVHQNAAAVFTDDDLLPGGNVQTVEGRSATVYAIKLKVEDPSGKLKPGIV